MQLSASSLRSVPVLSGHGPPADHAVLRCHGGCQFVDSAPFPACPKTTPSHQRTNHGSGTGWGYGLGLWSGPIWPPCWMHQRPWSSHLHQAPLPIFLLGSETQFWKSPTFHESTLRACFPWLCESWLAGLRSREGTGTTTHNQRIPRFLQNKRPRTGQYGVPPAATSALHILSGLMKAICRDSSTHLPSDGVLKDESNYETEGEKRTSYNESCGCFDVCKPAHVRASRVGMIKSRHIWSRMQGNLVFCLSVVGCRFQLETVWRLPLWHSRVQTFPSFEEAFWGLKGLQTWILT